MIKAVLVALAILALVVVAILLYAATRPNTLRVTRSALIAAPPERIYALLADFRRWTLWSPWENRDPQLRRTYDGAEFGVGATYAWEGHRSVGAGRMEILSADAPWLLRIALSFLRPFKADNVTEFRLDPEAGGTRVTWTMVGPALLVTKVMGLFMDMDAMIGRDFETGLANLKREAEGGALDPMPPA